MSNKLQDIFTKAPLERNTRLEFFSEDDYKSFINDLKKVASEGNPIAVNSVKAIHSTIGNGAVNYSDDCEQKIEKLVVYPCDNPITMKLNTEFGEEDLRINKRRLETGNEIKVVVGEVVEFVLNSDVKSRKTTFSYRTDLKKASSVTDLKRCIALALAFCKYVFENKNISDSSKGNAESQIVNINGVFDYFDNLLRIIKHLDYINEKFALNILPSELGRSGDFDDIEELYYSLQGKPIRSAKSVSSCSIALEENENNRKNNDELLGSILNLTFAGNVTYNILGHEVTLYSANYLFNAVVDEIEKIDDNNRTIVLKPETDKSMYMSYTAYETEEEANEGLKMAMDKCDDYRDAPTVAQLIAKMKEGQ